MIIVMHVHHPNVSLLNLLNPVDVSNMYICGCFQKKSGTPKWMVKIMVPKPYFLMDDLGVPLILETPILFIYLWNHL